MSIKIFSYLDDNLYQLKELGEEINQLVYNNPKTAIINARLYSEILSKEICSIESLCYTARTQLERINILLSEEIIPEDIAKIFSYIRMTGNKAVHNANYGDLIEALSIHKGVYEITKWFLYVYGSDYTLSLPEYVYPENNRREAVKFDEIEDIIEDKITRKIKGYFESYDLDFRSKNEEIISEDKHPKPEKAEVNINRNSADVSMLQDSELLYELSKLRESSIYAVENPESLSEYKQYLHIERTIQESLHHILKESLKDDKAKLILLSGSVGDGKTHLISYFKEKNPGLMSQFSIHNDATESYFPDKSSLETLKIELDSFSDINIKSSSKKQILAINLGVLHNFIESVYAEEYTYLKNYIMKSGIFESERSTSDMSPYFKLINFGEYNIFELSPEGLKSTYIDEVLSKITLQSLKNPFYRAYEKDIANGVGGIHIENYKLLMNTKVQAIIKKILAKSIFEEKEIISTRTLFNFFYDILVPDIDYRTVELNNLENFKYLLPNVLFESVNKSSLLTKISKMDPIHLRSYNMDEALVSFYNTDDYFMFFNEYLIISEGYKWLEGLKISADVAKKNEDILIKTFMRLSLVIGKENWFKSEDSIFDSFVNLLYGYQTKNFVEIEKIVELVKEATMKWNGNPYETFIFKESDGKRIKSAFKVELEADFDFYNSLARTIDDMIDKYKMSIRLSFVDKNNNNQIIIDLDFTLYKLLTKVVNGYRPNRRDRENALMMEEFVRNIIKTLSLKDRIIFELNNDNNLFELYTERKFGGLTYKFKRI